MHSTISIRANWVWTGVGQPQANVCVTIQNDRIVSVSTDTPTSAFDLGSYCILPGLINSHTHLEFSDLKQPVPASDSFADWILEVVNRRRDANDISFSESPEKRGLIESASTGVRLVLDIVHASDDATKISKSLDNSKPTTIRFAELMSTTELRAKQTWRAALKLKKENAANGSFGLSPHAPYTTTSDLIRQAVARCKRWKIPIMMHLAESLDEMRWVESGDGPLQDLLEMVSGPNVLSTKYRLLMPGYVNELCQAPLAFIVHANYLDDRSMAILESHRNHVAVVYCARTHAHFGHPTHPLMELRRRGIPVVLGTDSRASNPDLSIFEEARRVRQLFPDLSAAEIIRMITTRPADLLGCAEDYGYVRSSCLDRLSAIPCQAKKSDDVLEELLTSSRQAKPLEEIVNRLQRVGS